MTEQQPEAVEQLIAGAAEAQELYGDDELEDWTELNAWSCAFCCHGTVYFMGFLGSKEWGRCRDCGMMQDQDGNDG